MAKNGRVAKAPPKPVTAGSAGLINGIKTNLILPLLSNVWTYIIAGIVTIGSYIGIAGWHAADKQIKNYLAAAISEKLKDEIVDAKGPLYSALSNAVAKMRHFEVGEISAGAFILDPLNPSYELIVYLPPDKAYTAKLYYQVSNAYPNCHRVDVAFPSQKPMPLKLDEHSIDLVKNLFQPTSPQAQEITDTIIYDEDNPSQQLRKNLHAITFQLKGQATAPQANDPCSYVPQHIRISYATLVAPTIQLVAPTMVGQ